MRRAERKLQLSYNVVGEIDTEKKGNEIGDDTGDLRSVIFGLHMFDFTNVNEESSDEMNIKELSDMTDRLIERRHAPAQNDSRKFEVDPIEFFKGSDFSLKGSSAANLDPGLDESSYISWVQKFEEASQLDENPTLELGMTKTSPEGKHQKLEAARKKREEGRKKAEEEKIKQWEALGYQSLAVQDDIGDVGDFLTDSGSVQFVYGDCTQPASICPSEPTIIFR